MQLFTQGKINKNKLNVEVDNDVLDKNIKDIAKQILQKEENHGKLSKKLISYRPQRTDKCDITSVQELTDNFDQNEAINYRGVSRNGNFGW